MTLTLKTRHYIILKTLPWLFLVLLVSSGAMYWVADNQVKQRLTEKHLSHIQRFSDHLQDTKSDLQSQLHSIANNDLVVNGLIDLQARDSYIPVFINSYEFAGLPGVGLTMLDFAGEVIFSKNQDTATKVTEDRRWITQVLEQGKAHQVFNAQGLLMVEPILYGNMAEGALAMYVPMDKLRPLLAMDFGSSQVKLTGANETLIFSTSIADSFAARPDYQSDQWVTFRQVDENGFTISSMEPQSVAQEDMQWIQRSLALGIGISIFLTVLSTLLAGRLTSRTISRFSQAINDIRQGRQRNLNRGMEQEPLEFKQLRMAFSGLMQDLDSKTVSTERFDSILNSMTEILVVFDRNRKVLLKNQPFEDFFASVGLDDDSAFDSIVPLDTRGIVFEPELAIPDINRSYDLQNESDERRVIRWSRRIFSTEERQADGVVFVGVDISDSLKIEQELRIKNRAIEEASSSIVISDYRHPSMPLLYVNRAFEELTGYRREDVLGRNCRFLQGPETSQAAIERLRQAIKLGVAVTETLLNYRKDGSQFYNELALSPIFNSAGQLTHFLGIQIDVTKRIEAESYLKMAKDEAERSTQMKSEFLASMSHEIRTPMNGVLGMLGLLEDTKLDESQRKYVHLGQSSAKSLLVLINDILDFSKIEAGKLEIESVDFDLPALLHDFVETMAYRAQDKNLELILDISDVHHRMVKGDPGRVRQILTNLVSNAIKFTEKGAVTVSAHIEVIGNGRLNLRCGVKDTGIGIPKTKVIKLFDAFTQVDASTTRSFGGTGLGLAIVKQLCRLMNGDVTVVSEVGTGSTFSFNLELEHSDIAALEAQEGVLTGKRVLLVHEESQDLEAMVDMLDSLALKVRVTATAKESIALLRDSGQQIDAVVISKELAGISGETLGKAIKADKYIADTPLLMVTSAGQHGEGKRVADIGFAGYLTKPISAEQLQAALTQMMPVEAVPATAATPLITRHSLYSMKRPPKLTGHVLLAEDNDINQVVAKTMLEGMGLRVSLAGNGKIAVEQLCNSKQDPFDAILMDCQMPEMDGYEATKAIRQGQGGDEYRHAPIIAITAHAMTDDRQKCLAAGMNDYVSKPIEPSLLGEKLAHWLAIETHRKQSLESNAAHPN